MKLGVHWLPSATVSLTALTADTAAVAYDTGAASGSASAEINVPASVGDIIVTDLRGSQSINDVTIFTGNQLAARCVTVASALSKLVTGLTFVDSGFSAPAFAVRSVGCADGNLATTSTVAVDLYEVALSYPVRTLAVLLDAQRLHVIDFEAVDQRSIDDHMTAIISGEI